MSRRISVLVTVCLVFAAAQAPAAIFCPDSRTRMRMQNDLPWSAIGYLNNGCTATLIDSEHIQAAAHCFVHPTTGAWQTGPNGTGIRFYPNYNPLRGDERQEEPPWALVDRVVVGSRTEALNFPPPSFPAMDWGIGHLATPVEDFAPMPIQPAPMVPWPVRNAAYQRDPLRFPAPHPTAPAPETNPVADPPCGNCWWEAALVDPPCEIVQIQDHIVYASCTGMGGSSGSPFFWSIQTPTDGIAYFIAGSVFSGIQPSTFSTCETFQLDRAAFGPTAESFQYAPRFAHGVAVVAQTSTPGGKPSTQVFSSDSDEQRIVARRRQGSALTDAFAPFASEGDVPEPRRMAALNRPTGSHQLFVTTDGGDLYTRTQGGSWKTMLLPTGSSGALDVDTLYNVKGTTRVFLVTHDGQAFSKDLARKAPVRVFDTGWEPLPSVENETYARISAVEQAGGAARVFLLTVSGKAYTTEEVPARYGGTPWSTPEPFGDSESEPPLLEDIDAAWAPQAALRTRTIPAMGPRLRVFAVTKDGLLWLREAKSASAGDGWNSWKEWETSLVAPQVPGQPAPAQIVSVTATHWQENAARAFRPVVFATDAYGNIYYNVEDVVEVEIGVSARAWTNWLSFYHY